MRVHQDTRRRFVADLFPTPGDVNVVYLYAKEPIAWHRHQHQTDFLYCASGRVRIGIIGPESDVPDWTILGPHCGVLTIAPNHWHGYEPLGGEAILVSYISRKWDGTDEERVRVALPPFDRFAWPITPTP